MLSAQELFKYGRGLDKTVPQKGGGKDYLPDGSWLQNKRIEKFHEERQAVLSEPRVYRNGDLVKGQWNTDKKMVELTHVMKNFWSQMGFQDEGRLWLYPEEALFLIETNILEVWYDQLPLSIQEGYTMFLCPPVTLEYYQVYAHLRRMGYVVIRHQGRLDITKYEQQIRLDKYISKKDRKKAQRRKAEQDNSGVSVSPRKQMVTMAMDNTIVENQGDVKAAINQSELEAVIGTQCEKEGLGNIAIASETNEDTINVKEISETETIEQVPLPKYSDWDFNEIVFPNFCRSESVISILAPNKKCVPGQFSLSLNEYRFDKTLYINTKKEKREKGEKREGEIENLEFSYSEIMTNARKCGKSCKNWAEYKKGVKLEVEFWDRSHDLPHLYADGLQPLVKPKLATSTGAVLDQLCVIKEDIPDKQKTSLMPSTLPDFDVYMPDTKFRKSCPGVPNHRVCVTRSDASPADLSTVTAIMSYLGDEVPLHWAVVDAGDIAFYKMSDIILPLDIPIG